MDDKDISIAYKLKAQSAHPDKGGAPEEFQLVKEAYDQVKTPEARKRVKQRVILDGLVRCPVCRGTGAKVFKKGFAKESTRVATQCTKCHGLGYF